MNDRPADSAPVPPENREEEVIQLRTELATRDEILAVVAHDLRSPLNVLTMSLEILRQSIPDGQDANLERMRRAIVSMNELVTNLVDLSNLGRTGVPTSVATIYAEALLRDVVALQKPNLRSRGLTIEVVTGNAVPPVAADYERLLRAFADLINHAARKAESGSTIRLTARNAGSEDLPPNAARGVEFAVSHVGEPLLVAATDMSLSAFFRLPSADRKVADLGMAIARSIIEAHGGRILAPRQPQGEPVIRFCLPSPEAG